MIKRLILFSNLFAISLFANYQKPADISQTVWNDVQPYLLPYDNPLREKLDALFTSFRVTENSHSIQRAGFKNWSPALFSKAIVSQHKNFTGYYFKFYSDEQYTEFESHQWINRAFEARNLKKAIKELGYQNYFVVPKKWIYLIPDKPTSKSPFPKHFILIAKKINLEKSSKSRHKWRHYIKSKILDALYVLAEKEGLVDSLVNHNLPFAKDGRLAFIDLEHHHQWPVPFHRLLKYLNPSMQNYWQRLIDKQGP